MKHIFMRPGFLITDLRNRLIQKKTLQVNLSNISLPGMGERALHSHPLKRNIRKDLLGFYYLMQF